MNYEAVKVALPQEVQLAEKLIKIGFEKIEQEKVKNGNTTGI